MQRILLVAFLMLAGGSTLIFVFVFGWMVGVGLGIAMLAMFIFMKVIR